MEGPNPLAVLGLLYSIYHAWSAITNGSHAHTLESRLGDRVLGRAYLRTTAVMSVTASLFCLEIIVLRTAPDVVVFGIAALFLLGILLSLIIFFFSIPKIVVPKQWRSGRSLWSLFFGAR